MICKNCGSQIDDKAVLCVFCKKEVKKSLFRFPRFRRNPTTSVPVPPSVHPCRTSEEDLNRMVHNRILDMAHSLGTDLVIMDAHGSTCPECAKYQGRVYSISGRTAKYPRVPEFFFTTGTVHEGCSHSFHPYIDDISDPDLEYTLSVHPLKNTAYAKNIIAFSNRPFVDDRTNERKVSTSLDKEI